MSLISIKIYCPHCSSPKVVKNGKKSTGKQNFLCKDCRKQFQHEYLNKGENPAIQKYVKDSLLHGGGIRDNAAVFDVSRQTVLNIIEKEGKGFDIKPLKRHYSKVQIDEMYSFVGSKNKKVWIFYVYAPETKEILAYTMGKRTAKQVSYLLLKIKVLDIKIDAYQTDAFEGFKSIFRRHTHMIGKEYTKHIEGRNNCVRAHLARFQRRTTKFSKKLIYQWWLFNMFVQWLNNQAASYI